MPESSIAVWLKSSVCENLTREAERAAPYETGGVLMGYWSVDLKEVIVTDMIGPGPQAKHDRTTFLPDGSFQQAEIERIYTDSGRIVTYLGDWHTHPEGGSFLSARDLSTLRGIALNADARAPQPLMAILSGSADWRVTVWLMRLAWLEWLSGRRVVSLKILKW